MSLPTATHPTADHSHHIMSQSTIIIHAPKRLLEIIRKILEIIRKILEKYQKLFELLEVQWLTVNLLLCC